MKPKLISSNNGLVVKNLRKSLSQKTIVRDISLQVQRGQTIGLLGPNGAGKTTTFYMIMGLIQPDGGEINLDKKKYYNTSNACTSKTWNWLLATAAINI
jgi:lipopolysaccharide export system ATP-binding protein